MTSMARDVDFKDETEVQQYLENLGTEYRFGCYKERNPKACALLAQYMEAIVKDNKMALLLFEQTCNENQIAESCQRAGAFKLAGLAGESDSETAYNYFLKGCQGGYARACYNTAVLNDTPIAEERKWRASFQGKPELAKKFYKLACDIDNSAIIGCRKYGLSLFNSNPQRDPETMKEVIKYLDRGCEFKDFESCVQLGKIFKQGLGVEKDLQKGRKYESVANEIQAETEMRRPTIAFGE